MILRIKSLISKFISKTIFSYLVLFFKYNRKENSIFKTGIFFLLSFPKFYTPSSKLSKGKQIRKIFNKVKIIINDNDRFIHNIDVFKILHRDNNIIDNTTVDYSLILNNSLLDLKRKNKKMKDGLYKDNQYELLIGIEEYIDRICNKLTKSNNLYKDKIIRNLNNIKSKKAKSFEESIQRILFYNQLLWQCGYGLNGLGRLDKILEESYYRDIKNNIITKEKAKEVIKDMFNVLHRNFWYKSSGLLGDTGQIVILGGNEIDGSYFCNDLTYLFIEVIDELQIPDPKVFLRVSSKIPRDLMELSLKCIKTGVGSPLLSNDEVIIPKLINFGYDKKDAYNYVTSACWEPLIVGKSVEQNNIDSLVFIEPLNDMLNNENLYLLDTFDKFLNKYKKYLNNYIIRFANNINKIVWEESPLLSLFIEDCNKNGIDVSKGGAKYNNYGLTSTSLSNTVNSIYNIKKLVYEDKKYSLEEINNFRKTNFDNYEIKELKDQSIRFGTDNKEIIDLTNEITLCVSNTFNSIRNDFGGRFKFGFSAPTYIMKSTNAEASFDGRKNGDPFGVHISTDKAMVSYTELIGFATKLDYSDNRFNGNVIDFMITPNFIEDNFDKVLDFLLISIKLGFFQMQMNVLSSDILIKAKENPNDYKNLIVRVWGFSAYFNDLPESYKDLLIERALKNEGKSI